MSATLMSEFGANLARQLEARNAGSKADGNATLIPVVQPGSETTGDEVHQRSQTGPAGTLTRIESVTGPLRAYDGRYCVWGSNGPFDVRDIAQRLSTDADTVVDNLPEFKPATRGRRHSDDDTESE